MKGQVLDLTGVMQQLYASEINCAVQSQWDAGFGVSIGGDTLYGRPEASETFAADELADAAAWLDEKARELYPKSDYALAVYPVGVAPTFNAKPSKATE